MDEPSNAALKDVKIGESIYRPVVRDDGRVVHLDVYGEVPPGDPDGPWQWASTQIAKAHREQHREGWEYMATTQAAPPPGGDWEINTCRGDDGRDGERTYWRRRIPGFRFGGVPRR